MHGEYALFKFTKSKNTDKEADINRICSITPQYTQYIEIRSLIVCFNLVRVIKIIDKAQIYWHLGFLCF